MKKCKLTKTCYDEKLIFDHNGLTFNINFYEVKHTANICIFHQIRNTKYVRPHSGIRMSIF